MAHRSPANDNRDHLDEAGRLRRYRRGFRSLRPSPNPRSRHANDKKKVNAREPTTQCQKMVTPKASGFVTNPPAANNNEMAAKGKPQNAQVPPRDPPHGQVVCRDNESGRRTESRQPRPHGHRYSDDHRGCHTDSQLDC